MLPSRTQWAGCSIRKDVKAGIHEGAAWDLDNKDNGASINNYFINHEKDEAMKRLGREFQRRGKNRYKDSEAGTQGRPVCVLRRLEAAVRGEVGASAGPCRCTQAFGFHFILFHVHRKALA